MKRCIFVLVCSLAASLLHAQIPEIPLNQIYFMKTADGWDLYIKKIPGIESIILTESQRDPEYQVTSYSLRSTVLNPANAAEKRLLDGRTIKSQDATCYLIDSTPEKVSTIGEFYHFFMTDDVLYGYRWARNGKMKIDAGVRINLRKFERKYGDYRGRFKDQWIVLTPQSFPQEKAEVKPAPKVEEPRVETTIVLLHSSDVDAEIAPSPKPSPKPEAKPALMATVEKLAGLAGGKKSVSQTFAWLVVDTIEQFPFERIKDAQPAAGTALKAGEARVLCKYLFETDENKTAKNAGFATYHEDTQGRLVRINEYGKDNRLTVVYKIEYQPGAEPVTVTPFDRDGKAIAPR
jgi:hypothetical protein